MLLEEIPALAGDPLAPLPGNPVWVAAGAVSMARPRDGGGSTIWLRQGGGLHVTLPFPELVALLRAEERGA